MRFKKIDDLKIHVVCAGITNYARSRLWVEVFHNVYDLQSLSEICNKNEINENEVKTKIIMQRAEFPQPFEDEFNYMNNVPIYMEHKLPDTMSSFPLIIKPFISNCEWEDVESSRIVDGSNIHTKCAHPFYKEVNMTKGENDQQDEQNFISKCLAMFHEIKGGAYKPKPNTPNVKPSSERLVYKGRNRIVYLGKRGGKYIVIKGSFVLVKSLLKYQFFLPL
jgi:hypothetical protein